jgi:hypothetical protein
MRKYLLLILTALICCHVTYSQKTISDPNVQLRDLKGYHAISVSYGVQLILTQSESEAVAVSALTIEDRDHIKTVVEDGVLIISYAYDLWKLWKNTSNKKLKVYVAVVRLDRVTASAGSTVKVEGEIKSADLFLNFSSGANFDGRVEATALRVNQSSGSRVVLTGSAKDIECEGNSGSRLHAYEFVVDNNCDARIHSGARIEITVNGELSARVSSGGRVQYRGSGVIRNIRSGSGGHVSRG